MTCMPVSVIHQVSCGATPVIERIQRSASGLSGSPTEQLWRMLFKSYFLAIAFPCAISMRKAVGALYQTVTLYFSIASYQRSAEKRPPSTRLEIPSDQGP